MTVVVHSDVHFDAATGKPIGTLPERHFTGLDTADYQLLSDWLAAAAGIDAVIDLAVRPWNVAGAIAIAGVFETASDQASWLIVRFEQGWLLVQRENHCVSDVAASLSDILNMIDDHRRRV